MASAYRPKTAHAVFSVTNLIDEAWLKRGAHLPHDPAVYDVMLDKVIGSKGESVIRIVVKPGTSEVISAYPIK
jgi:filamentous hemagglutinin